MQNITTTDFDNIIKLVTQYTGIVPRDSHKEGIKRYVENRIATLDKGKGSFNYYSYLLANQQEIVDLVNSSTVNETYFFREQAQFALLKNKLLPELSRTNIPVKIWSAACSSGEEAYSLLLLAKALKIKVELSASDINTECLETCKKGEYKARSLRTVDGAAFSSLLEPYKKQDGSFTFPSELSREIKLQKLNLADMAYSLSDTSSSFQVALPRGQHIVFIRNVFIYFSREVRSRILKFIATNCMAPNSYLFVSMNEIPAWDALIIPSELKKVSHGNVFYFQKQGGGAFL